MELEFERADFDSGAGPAQTVYSSTVVLPRLTIFRLRQRSLARGVLLSVGAFAASLLLAGFPHIERLHGSDWQMAALVVAVWGMVETGRCLQPRWSFYHAGVMILLWTDLIVLAAIVALLTLI
jgi:hypothetical protein